MPTQASSKGSNRPVEKASWDDAQIFLSRLNSIEQTAGRLPTGWKYVLPTEAQWEYACRAGTTTHTRGAMISIPPVPIITWDGGANDGTILNKPAMWASMRPTPGAFLTCREMCGNGSATGRRTILPVPRPIPRVRHRARIGSTGWFLDHGGTHLRSARRTTHPQLPSTTYRLPCWFPTSPARHGESRTGIVRGSRVTREAGQAWAEPGAAGHDARDGNLTSSITVTGTVDMNTTGTYILTYSVADAAGNTATANRTVTVVGNRSVDLNATVAMDMLWVPAGTFTMGSPTTEAGRQSDREDEHNVSLTKGFYLGKYEVTQAQYEAVMTGNTDELKCNAESMAEQPESPVEKVSWADAQIFLTRLNAQQSANIPAGWAYVLPTESQWEYACRAGTTTATHGDDNCQFECEL